MMSIMCGADLPGHDSAFERGEEAVHGLVLVDRFQLGEILPSEPEEHVLVDPHAMGQPLDARPLLLAQGNEVQQGPQRLCDEGDELAHLHAIDAGQELIISDSERMKAERAEVCRFKAERFAARTEAHTSELQSLMRITFAV